MVNDQDGIPGQNNSNPPSIAIGHQLVQIGGVYYDPSYGLTFTSLADFEGRMIDGYTRPLIIREDLLGEDVNGDDVIDGTVVTVFLFRRPRYGQAGQGFQGVS